MARDELTKQLASAASSRSSWGDKEMTVGTSVSMAVDMIDNCDAASISVNRRDHGIETSASTNDMVAHADAMQVELGEGPCVDTLWHDDWVRSADLSADSRWPTWGPRVVNKTGLLSMLNFQLFVTSNALGVLSLYSRQGDAFTSEDRTNGQALAAHVSVALSAADEVQNLGIAVTSRTVIGQAEGILMERFNLSPEEAFRVLQRVSSHSNTKLNQVASELVRTRALPKS